MILTIVKVVQDVIVQLQKHYKDFIMATAAELAAKIAAAAAAAAGGQDVQVSGTEIKTAEASSLQTKSGSGLK